HAGGTFRQTGAGFPERGAAGSAGDGAPGHRGHSRQRSDRGRAGGAPASESAATAAATRAQFDVDSAGKKAERSAGGDGQASADSTRALIGSSLVSFPSLVSDRLCRRTRLRQVPPMLVFASASALAKAARISASSA